MSNTATKRAYARITPATWAEIEALWRTGEPTLAELANRYGCTERALQARFAKHRVVKGSTAKMLAATVEAEIVSEMMLDPDTMIERARDIRESTYANAVRIETMIAARLDAASRDPSATFAAAAAIKMLSNAAQALERIHSLKRAVIGLRDDADLDNDLPVLEIADLTQDDIDEMRREQEELDGNLSPDETQRDRAEADDIVELA